MEEEDTDRRSDDRRSGSGSGSDRRNGAGRNDCGKYGIIEKTETVSLSAPETSYNLEVEDFHTYFVGENPVCVHNNKCGEIKRGANSIEQEGVKVEVRPGEALGKTNHNTPHAHVSGKGPNTTVGLNKNPVNKSHKPLSTQQKRMISRNWNEIEDLIRRVWP